MTYFLDFDNTLFDSDAYVRALANHPACAPFKEELLAAIAGGRNPHYPVWDNITDVLRSGELSFAPGELAAFVYKDVPEFLRMLGNEAIVITFGEKTRQQLKIENALASIVRLTVVYTEMEYKADFLSHNIHLISASSIFVDDSVQELERLANQFPQMRLFEMRRDGGVGDGRFPVIRSLSELP